MKIIICLGNPGKEYYFNRHNIGFRVGEQLIKDFFLEKKGKKFKSLLYEGFYQDQKIMLVFPQTYMNLSGIAVQLITGFYQIDPKEILVIYDDFDIPFQDIRVRIKGSAGTHNGMKSIIQQIKTTEFPRIRIGVGPKPDDTSASDFVLSNFTQAEEKNIPDICSRAGQAVQVSLKI